ncbi:unnamed protein product [Closterium sp. Yama58-4]|nr:unnamed protein product [Closterium sp. Yama58-4]
MLRSFSGSLTLSSRPSEDGSVSGRSLRSNASAVGHGRRRWRSTTRNGLQQKLVQDVLLLDGTETDVPPSYADVARMLGLAGSLADRQPVSMALCILRVLDMVGQTRPFVRVEEGSDVSDLARRGVCVAFRWVREGIHNDESNHRASTEAENQERGREKREASAGVEDAPTEPETPANDRSNSTRNRNRFGDDRLGDERFGGGRRELVNVEEEMGRYAVDKACRHFIVSCLLDLLQLHAHHAFRPQQPCFNLPLTPVTATPAPTAQGASDQVVSNRVVPEQVVSEQVVSEQVVSEAGAPYRLGELAEVLLVESTVATNGMNPIECAHLDRLYLTHGTIQGGLHLGPGILALAVALAMQSLPSLWPDDVAEVAEFLEEMGCEEAGYRARVRVLGSVYATEADCKEVIRRTVRSRGVEPVRRRIQRVVGVAETALTHAPTEASRSAPPKPAARLPSIIPVIPDAEAAPIIPWVRDLAEAYLRLSRHLSLDSEGVRQQHERHTDVCACIILRCLVAEVAREREEARVAAAAGVSSPGSTDAAGTPEGAVEAALLGGRGGEESSSTVAQQEAQERREREERDAAMAALLVHLDKAPGGTGSLAWKAIAVLNTHLAVNEEGTGTDVDALELFDWSLESLLVTLPGGPEAAASLLKVIDSAAQWDSAARFEKSAARWENSAVAGSCGVARLSDATRVDVLLAIAARVACTIYWRWPRRRDAPRFVAQVLTLAHGTVGMTPDQLQRALKIGERLWGWTMPSPASLQQRCETPEEAREIRESCIISAWYSTSAFRGEEPIELIGSQWPYR